MKENENFIIIQDEYICNICNSKDKYFICGKCFKKYNSTYLDKKNNLEKSEKSLSEKIAFLLSTNNNKSKTLNKKILSDKYKQILLEKIKQEENQIKEYEEESKKYEKIIIEQKDKNQKLNLMLNKENQANNQPKLESGIFESAINLNGSNIDFNANNDNIDNIKNEINEINTKIMNYKQKYIFDLFEASFIKNKTILKIKEFFNIEIQTETKKEINNMGFSTIDLKDETKSKEINLEILKKKENNIYIYLERFNSFFKSMVNTFLGEAYKKFKLEIPFKMDYPKIMNDNGTNINEYKMELEYNKLDDNIVVDKAIKGFHLLHINYEYLINYIFGDSKKLNYLFDLSIFLVGKDENLGSTENIKEEYKFDDNFGFEVL